MSIPDHEIDYPDPNTDFTCLLCGDVKPVDDLATQSPTQYESGVCWKCYEEVEPESVKAVRGAIDDLVQRIFRQHPQQST